MMNNIQVTNLGEEPSHCFIVFLSVFDCPGPVMGEVIFRRELLTETDLKIPQTEVQEPDVTFQASETCLTSDCPIQAWFQAERQKSKDRQL